jgi:putative oxidoreductase
MIKKILATRAGLATSLLHIVLGIIFIKEGSGKLFGWFGGGGIADISGYFQNLGIPFPLANAYLVGYTEFLGGIALLAGFLTRLAALPIVITMLVAIFSAHRDGGYNYPLLILASCLVLVQAGGGPFSLDRLMTGRRESSTNIAASD